jgi:phosphatidylinositol glycan class M
LFLAWFLPFLLDDGNLIQGVSYTDIDFYVFTDAAHYIQQHKSPYDRHTYRYTPFLAALLAVFHRPQVAARYLFCGADALCGWILSSLRRRRRRQAQHQESDDWQDALWWLYNPLAINICTRGSAESLMVLLPILGTFWLATLRRETTMLQVCLTGVCHGIAVHSKLYPIIYSLSYMAYFATPPRTAHDVVPELETTRHFPWKHPLKLCRLAKLWIQRLTRPLPVAFSVTFLATFVFLTWLAVYCYGEVALQEGLLYHFGRVDHRHNYSMYWYWIYLARAQRESLGAISTGSSLSQIGKVLLLPQAFLLAYSSLGMAPTELGLALFVQTYLFVSHNKVITAQYFTWYLCLLPLCSDRIQFQSRRVITALLLLGLSIVCWLGSAYLLEMQGMAVHRMVWGASVAYFFANVNVMGAVLQSVKIQQQQQRTEDDQNKTEKKRQ